MELTIDIILQKNVRPFFNVNTKQQMKTTNILENQRRNENSHNVYNEYE